MQHVGNSPAGHSCSPRAFRCLDSLLQQPDLSLFRLAVSLDHAPSFDKMEVGRGDEHCANLYTFICLNGRPLVSSKWDGKMIALPHHTSEICRPCQVPRYGVFCAHQLLHIHTLYPVSCAVARLLCALLPAGIRSMFGKNQTIQSRRPGGLGITCWEFSKWKHHVFAADLSL